MSIHFKVELSRVTSVSITVDEDAEAPFEVLAAVCDALQDTGHAAFTIAGLGEPWHLSVGNDLLTFLEQLPEVIVAVNAGKPFVFDFFEQGTERKLSFDPVDDHYSVREGYPWWAPEIGTVARPILTATLVAAMETFMRFLGRHAPEVERHPLIQAWAQARMNAWGDAL